MTNKADRTTGADVYLAEILVLGVINEGRMLHQVTFLRGRLARKVKAGTYDPILAGRAWRYTVEMYLPTYKRECDDSAGRVDVATRNLAGRFLEENQREHVYAEAGVPEANFDAQDAELRAMEVGNV